MSAPVRFSALVAVLAVLGGFCFGQLRVTMPVQVEITPGVSDKALRDFRALAERIDPRSLGFKSREEARAATLGTPLRVFMVRLDRLKAWDQAADAAGLLSGGDTAFYPLNIGAEARSMIVLDKIGATWRLNGFGWTPVIQRLDRQRRSLTAGTGVATTAFFVVRVPAFNIYFLGRQAPEGLLLTSLFDHPDLGIRAGLTVPAARAIALVLPAARRHTGLPG